jgi:GAF domain-containing protein
MKNDENEIVGVLQLLNARHPVTGEVVPFSDEDRELAESLASQAALALTHVLLINRLQVPFESSISLVNGHISHQFPCRRAL